ncbi:MAG: hypothetical protein IPJ40_13400 [Saprospirales bacterium]|nr:hypothetical protein [Saprospirales bacterium]
MRFASFSQTVTVVNITDLQPIANAAIFSMNPPASAISNAKDKADLNAFRGADSIRFSHVGYSDRVLKYSEIEK